ncbi:hypothetical protein E2C01_043738 [Portunus trituberculatus]|uniref:Uncharacterized protein n=1 Tax=Portunus trituberculatus TaxID=210409 RepID=A0A5B7G0C7_PORTR|nr:hypothetical protein [Portunus trituberculatus]
MALDTTLATPWLCAPDDSGRMGPLDSSPFSFASALETTFASALEATFASTLLSCFPSALSWTALYDVSLYLATTTRHWCTRIRSL